MKKTNEEHMTKRGKILRDTSAGQGLLSMEGKQFPFDLEGVWKSALAPALNMVVDVELNDEGKVVALHVVPEAQLAKEQAAIALAAAKAKGTQVAAVLISKFGVPTLIALLTLTVSWFFLDSLSIQMDGPRADTFSFWRCLGALNTSGGFGNSAYVIRNASVGFYGFLAIVVLAAPLAPYFWKDSRAQLGNLLPLLFMLTIGLLVSLNFRDVVKESVEQVASTRNLFSGFSSGRSNPGNVPTDQMLGQAMSEIWKAIHLQIGFYISFAVSLFFAVRGSVKFLANRA